MTRQELLGSIIADLGANYQSNDSIILGALLDDVINDALFISNRRIYATNEANLNNQITLLSSEIKKCVKSIYLQRGSEDVNNQSLNGMNATYMDARNSLAKDIIAGNKRIML